MTEPTRLKPRDERNTPKHVAKKIDEYAVDGRLLKITAVCHVLTTDGVLAELIIASDNVDRLDLLSAGQIMRTIADAFYRQLLEAGQAATEGGLH